MTPRAKIWTLAGVGLLVWLIFTWVLGWLLEVTGSDLWVLRGGLAFVGVATAGVLVWYYLKALKKSEGDLPKSEGNEIDTAIAITSQRIAAARYAERGKLSQLPVVLVIGPVGSAKTTIIARSGLDPELLSGEVMQGDAVVATRVLNAWYSNKTVFLEAGGRVVSDAGRFSRLVKHLQPSRLAAVFSAGRQAPRAAIVCLSAEELLKPGAGEEVMTQARELRTRLLEISQRLGIWLPVYVVFTKTDKVPYFGDYVRNFSADEAREVLGATLPWDSGSAGNYAERTGQRVGHAMSRLLGSLASHRLQYLPRETQPEVLFGAYEFAREFRKLVPLASQFLVELCKPSQLERSPVLRGFYFGGVRAVVSEDGAAAAPAPAVERRAEPQAFNATMAFVPGAFAAAQPTEPMRSGASMRKVPQWMFLPRLFRDVILKDRVAMAATAGGAKVNIVRRALLATAAALAFVSALGFTVSYVKNNRLAKRVEEASRSLSGAALPAGGELITVETLQRMDSLRAVTAQLSEWKREGAPLGLRWGLYSGNALYTHARSIYFARFDSLLFGPTALRLVEDIRNLPAQPTDSSDYGASYALLKAHLVTTSNADKSTSAFLVPVLAREWAAGKEPSADRERLAAAQFTFYAEELARANPLPQPVDTSAVEHGRAFLRQFKGGQQIYQIMLAAASKSPSVKPFDYGKTYANPAVSAAVVVPGPFTKAGWTFMQDSAFKNTDQFFKGEEWVLGGETVSERERREITDQVKAMYREEYATRWKGLLAQAKVTAFAGIADGSKKLLLVGGNPSPLLQLFNAVSVNTAVDSQMMAIFQPVRTVSPADSTKLIGEKTQPYMQAVLAVGTALQNVASAAPGQNEGPAQDAKTQAAAARNAALNITLAFTGDAGATAVGSEVRRLLTDPLGRVDPLLGNVGVAGVNKGGSDFCRVEGKVLTKSPFKAGGPPAKVAEVSDFFQRNTSALWNFYNGQLAKYLVPQGDGYAAAPGAAIKVNPKFVAFFSRAAQVSRGLFPENQPGPRLTFGFRPLFANDVVAVTFNVDGQNRAYTRTRASEQLLNWVGADAQTVKLDVTIGGNTQSKTKAGTWGLWELFAEAKNWKNVGGRLQAEWAFKHEGKDVVLPFELNIPSAPSIFDPGWLAGLACVSTVASP